MGVLLRIESRVGDWARSAAGDRAATAARAPATVADPLVAAVRGIRRTNEWARLVEFSTTPLTSANLVELFGIDLEDAQTVLRQLCAAGVKTVDALLTAAERVEEDAITGAFSAKGGLAQVTVPGALRQIAALRDRVKSEPRATRL